MSIQYIADGYNKDNQRVVLWRTGNYQYQLESAGTNYDFEAEYYDAVAFFEKHVVQITETA
jgi:hypothetical protein